MTRYEPVPGIDSRRRCEARRRFPDDRLLSLERDRWECARLGRDASSRHRGRHRTWLSANPAARALRTRRSGVIGFVPRPARTTPYKEPVADLLGIYIARAAMALGHHVVEASAETDVSRGSQELSRFLLGWRVDGVIFDSPSSEDEVQRFLDAGVPIVQLMRPRTGVATATMTVDSSAEFARLSTISSTSATSGSRIWAPGWPTRSIAFAATILSARSRPTASRPKTSMSVLCQTHRSTTGAP